MAAKLNIIAKYFLPKLGQICALKKQVSARVPHCCLGTRSAANLCSQTKIIFFDLSYYFLFASDGSLKITSTWLRYYLYRIKQGILYGSCHKKSPGKAPTVLQVHPPPSPSSSGSCVITIGLLQCACLCCSWFYWALLVTSCKWLRFPVWMDCSASARETDAPLDCGCKYNLQLNSLEICSCTFAIGECTGHLCFKGCHLKWDVLE